MNPGILKIKYFHNIQEVPHLLLKFESTSKVMPISLVQLTGLEGF